MGSLRINKINYEGNNYYFHSELFDKNLVVIEGDNGTGKSTFCNLIYFGLGGRVNEFLRDATKRHKEITEDSNNYVELFVTISGKNYCLKRFINDNDIIVTPYSVSKNEETGEIIFDLSQYSQQTEVFPIYRQSAPRIFSDWMLEQLEISVVEIYQGYNTFKINFTDLLRLIYHDQQADPEFIYKQIDVKGNHISDSELLRKAIFELLIGKSFSLYYESIAQEKIAEREKLLAKSLLDEFRRIADVMRGKEELRNKVFLQTSLIQKQDQIDKLHNSRNAFKRNRNSDFSVESAIDDIKAEMMSLEIDLSEKNEAIISLLDEKSKLYVVKENTENEISQLAKIIHSHDQLNLFSADTCPYCLTKVDRVAGHCVCGSDIDEKKYERFFYTSLEYKQILKSKHKTLATIGLAISGCNDELQEIHRFQAETNNRVSKLKVGLRSAVGNLDQKVDIDSLNDIDDKILELREEVTSLYQKIETETRLEGLQASFDNKRELHEKATLKRKALENEAKDEVITKVSDFSKIYNRLITETLSGCRSARISNDNYLPIINDGEYKETSSGVSIRLMYYLTLLEMSLAKQDVAFPKFLLIDTPETAGIELDYLLNCMSKFDELDEFGINYQIILTTGLGKYPQSFSGKRVLYLPNKENSLLKPKSIIPSNHIN